MTKIDTEDYQRGDREKAARVEKLTTGYYAQYLGVGISPNSASCDIPR